MTFCSNVCFSKPPSADNLDLRRTRLNKHRAEARFTWFHDQLNKCIIYAGSYYNSWLINSDRSALYCLCLETLLFITRCSYDGSLQALLLTVSSGDSNGLSLASTGRASNTRWPRHDMFSAAGTRVLQVEVGSYLFVKDLGIPNQLPSVFKEERFGGFCCSCY